MKQFQRVDSGEAVDSGPALYWDRGRAGSPADVFLSAGVLGSPASSDEFTPAKDESVNFDKVAFNVSGRGARGPSKSGPPVKASTV
jgi:hypothetical protein